MKKIQIDNVLIALRRVIRATDIHSHNLARKSGLTTPQLLLLQAIKKQGEVTIGTLAEDVSLSQATVTSILDRLVAKELIVRKRSELDKRKVHAYLTDQGKKTLKKAPSELPEWEQHMIIASLQKVADMMDAGDIDAAPVLDVGTLDRKEKPA